MTESGKQESKGRGARRRARYREIAKIVWEERLFDLLTGTGLEEQLPPELAGQEKPAAKEADQPLPVRVRHALERLGPVFIKMGQLLATRGDLLPPAFIEELSKLQDDVPAVPGPEMKKQLESELGEPVEDLFDSFSNTPIAAASIGQVYKAALRDSTPVAVKIQRPGVGEAMNLDLDILHELAAGLARHVEWAREYDAVAVAEGFSSVLRAELDYTKEALALDRFSTNFADDPSIVFPQVYWDHSTSRILTMDLLEGVPATERDSERGDGIDWPGLVRAGVNAYFRMIFEHGFYHADPHPGNVFALPDGRLGFVDCGRVAEVSQRNSEMSFDMMMAVIDDDPAAATEAVMAMTGNPPDVDLAALGVDMEAIIAKYRQEQAGGKGLTAVVHSLLRMLRVHHLRLPGELTLLLTTVGVLEGSATQLDPDFQMIEVIKPFARRYVFARYSPEHVARAMVRSGRAYARFFDRLPADATRALRRLGDGDFNVALRPEHYEVFVDRLTAVFYLLAYAIIIAGLTVGFAFLVGQQSLSPPERIVYRVILYAAIASLIWLMMRTLVSEWRRRKHDRRP